MKVKILRPKESSSTINSHPITADTGRGIRITVNIDNSIPQRIYYDGELGFFGHEIPLPYTTDINLPLSDPVITNSSELTLPRVVSSCT